MLALYISIAAVPPWLRGVAAVVAVIRANKNDLPAIVRALMRMGPRNDDAGKPPPSLPDEKWYDFTRRAAAKETCAWLGPYSWNNPRQGCWLSAGGHSSLLWRSA